MSIQTSEDLEHKYKDTIDLPQTDFPMRGNGPVREPEFQARWNELDVYQKALELRENENAASFILHDGPPYLSSDKIHIGTALNKILKDIIIKYKCQKGFKTPYVPGYDSHGLPIENAVVKEIKGGRQAVSIIELREKCKEFALKNLKGQEEKFKRLGVLGDWDNPYVTLDPKFEAEQVKLFAEMAEKGFIYRGLKTVYWSYGAETALADAEVEYKDDHESNAIYVAFKIKSSPKQGLEDARLVIWTTTPWTIPGNLAICLGESIEYVVAQGKECGKIIIAKALKANIEKDIKEELDIIGESFAGKELEATVCQHPLFDRESPVIFGDHVTTEAGTGCVHTAPGHGQEDFEIGKKYKLDILCPVDGRGVYTAKALEYQFKDQENLEFATKKNQSLKQKLENRDNHQGNIKLEGFQVIKQGNDLMIAALKDSGALLACNKLIHSYPYCWRSKTPLLYRATEQWFASVDGFRKEALSEIDKVKWIPERGRNRIYKMVEDRGDWCISRQRTWGVPIPALYDQTQINEDGNKVALLDKEIIEHVAQIFAEEGSSAWYAKETSELIPENLHAKYPPENFKIEMDTMDVWFDSGSTHRSVVAQFASLLGKKKFEPVDLYLEGSDQHRGWFQSSLLTSVATNGFAPYKSVLTHGFVMDEKGRKMSKSLGNVVDPQKVIDKFGADIVRLWVASVDYSIDIKVGDNMFKQLSDIYRNFRNTSRYMLGNLHDFDPKVDTVDYADLWDLDRLILHRLQNIIKKLTECFDQYQFFKYYQVIQNFCSVDLSAFYFDIIKDRLYTHGTDSKSRRSAQTVIYQLLSTINRMFVPVLPHLAEDIFTHSPQQIKDSYKDNDFFMQGGGDSILLSNWPQAQSEFIDDKLDQKWQRILEIREQAFKEIEILRQEKKEIGKSLEAKLKLQVESEDYQALESIADEIKAVFIVSSYELTESSSRNISASKFNGQKCYRCWKYFAPEEIKDGICNTCSSAIK